MMPLDSAEQRLSSGDWAVSAGICPLKTGSARRMIAGTDADQNW